MIDKKRNILPGPCHFHKWCSYQDICQKSAVRSPITKDRRSLVYTTTWHLPRVKAQQDTSRVWPQCKIWRHFTEWQVTTRARPDQSTCGCSYQIPPRANRLYGWHWCNFPSSLSARKPTKLVSLSIMARWRSRAGCCGVPNECPFIWCLSSPSCPNYALQKAADDSETTVSAETAGV